MSTNFENSDRPETSGVVSAAALKVPKRPHLADIDQDLTDKPATLQTGPEKGGKGGEGGEPALPPSNLAFLNLVMRNVTAGARVAICSKSGDPTAGGWPAEAANDVDRQCPPDRNNYFNCSTYITDEGENIQARKDRFDAFHVLVLDDVGTKVPRERIAGVAPTWEIETSPGNSQVGFVLTDPIKDLPTVKRLQDAVMAAGLCDPGASGSGRWVRLPHAINGKAKYRIDGVPFVCRLVRFDEQATFTVEALVDALGLTFDALDGPISRAANALAKVALKSSALTVPNDVWMPPPVENPVLAALKHQRLYKSQISPGIHDITCPWVGEHTDGLDSGSAYFEPTESYPTGGFKCQHSHGDKYHVGDLLKFLDVDAADARANARIRIVPGEMNRIRRAAETALAVRGGFYQSGGVIVSIRTDPFTTDVRIEVLGEPALTSALSDAADWERYDKNEKKWIRTDPPARNVQAVHKAQHYDTLPVLNGLSRQPFFRDGDDVLITSPGYDAPSGRFSAFRPEEFELPEPTEEAARAALQSLEDLLDEFRFASEKDKSAAICAMLTGAVRSSLPVAPAFNITASTPGSGKSYLAATITPFAGPGIPLKIGYPQDGVEASKAMLAALQPGPAVILFDDMQTQWLPHGVINRMLTSDTITDRVLGASRTSTVSTRTLILGTGNNVGPVRDMNRRLVTINLHHKVATPALEKYVGQPAEKVAKERGKFVAMAMTIIAAYRRAGSPKADVQPIASYEAWSDMCRQPLIWLGLPDPASSIIEQLQQDPDQDLLGHLLKAWHDAVGHRAITLRQLLDEAVQHESLQDALLELPVTFRDTIDRNKLGWFFKHSVNRVVHGYELQKAQLKERNGWRVVKVDETGSP
jgi:hypothetical protein